MKPNKLVLENIGPFTEKTEIDFSELGSMFLICGDTGAGKTTILDSICYALYGSLPGSHPRMARNLRSDFAPKDADARVIFDFSINGSRYKIERMPPKPYTDRNGKATEKPSEVVLFRYSETEPGKKWTLLYNKTSEADAAINDLIGLSIKEFSKIVLLPQGDFADFLRLSSNDRKNALAKLFPIDDYRFITEFAKTKADNFFASQKQITAQIDNLQKSFDFEHADEDIQKLEESEIAGRKNLTEMNKLQMQLAGQLENARALNQKFDDLASLNEEKEKISAQKSFIENLEMKLEQNRKAFLVKPSYENFKDLQNRLESSEKRLELIEKELDEAQAEKEKLESDKSSIEDKKAKIAEIPSFINELKRALAIEKDMTEFKGICLVESKRKDELSGKLDKIKAYSDSLKQEASELEALILPQDELEREFDQASRQLEEAKTRKNYLDEYLKLQQEVENDKAGLDSSSARYEKSKKNLELLKVEIQELEAQLYNYEQKQKAFTLAKNLKEGEPCPVCGSEHHPKLADFLSEDFSIEERLKQKKENLPEIESLERESYGIYSGVKSRYEKAIEKLEASEKPFMNADELLAEASQKMNDAHIKRDKNRQNNYKLSENRHKQEKYSNDIDFMQKDLQNSLQNYASVNTKYENLKWQYDLLTKDKLAQNESASDAIESYNIKLASLQDETASYEKRREDVVKRINELSATKELVSKQTEEFNQQFSDSEVNLKKELSLHSFASLEALQDAFLSEDERISYENQSKEWKTRKEQLAGMIDKLSSETEGLSRPDIRALEEKSADLTEEYNDKTNELNEIVLKKHEINENLKHWQKLNEERRDIEEKSRTYVALAKDLSGDNAKKLSFESWILGVYLEEIAVHASRRLSRISDGRYSLHLRTDKASGHQRYAGLDLEIFDANTGKKRPCDTLSGGETFFVSISLALALTDVVQSRSGGVQLDSLFIDEGFGSLDDTTLEKALSVLDEIRENRMIGIISHVGELRTRIHNRIEVTKKQSGSTLTTYGELLKQEINYA